MKILLRFFKKKKESKCYKSESDIYAYMGSLGISSSHMKMYQDSMKKIKEYKNSLQE